MLYESVDRGKIETLVRNFYGDILQDEMLRPFFVKALGDDLDNGKWYEHRHTLVNFWRLMMEGEKGYNGDPFPPHAFLGPLSRENFEQWLKLFKVNVYGLFTPEIAEKFYRKADILAEQFIENLGIDDEDDDD